MSSIHFVCVYPEKLTEPNIDSKTCFSNSVCSNWCQDAISTYNQATHIEIMWEKFHEILKPVKHSFGRQDINSKISSECFKRRDIV